MNTPFCSSLPLVAIILLNWNGREDTLACLDSLRRMEYANYQIILVDNASQDGLCDIVQAAYPAILLIKNSRNVGFAEGCNLGMRLACQHGCDYVLLLNNDTTVHPAFLSELVKAAETHPASGMFSPVIYYADPPDRVWFYTAGVDWQTGFAYHVELASAEIARLPQQPVDTEYAPGCALFVRREVIDRIGEFDRRFFAYYEDVDWCVRCQKAGWRITVVPLSVIWHKLSSHQNSDYGTFLKYRNVILLLWKHSNWLEFWRRVQRHIYKALAEYSWDQERYRQTTQFHPLDGIWAGIAGKYGAYRKKMPALLNKIIYHTIRYWLWLFRDA